MTLECLVASNVCAEGSVLQKWVKRTILGLRTYPCLAKGVLGTVFLGAQSTFDFRTLQPVYAGGKPLLEIPATEPFFRNFNRGFPGNSNIGFSFMGKKPSAPAKTPPPLDLCPSSLSRGPIARCSTCGSVPAGPGLLWGGKGRAGFGF